MEEPGIHGVAKNRTRLTSLSLFSTEDFRGRPGFDPWVGKFPGEGNGNPLQYFCLENPMDGGAWCPWGRKELDTTE